MANIELPKDAEGREIPLGTKALYEKEGDELRVKRVEFDVFDGSWCFAVKKDSLTLATIYRRPQDVYLVKPAPPDSWEKLFEDLDRCIKESSLCMYYSTSGSCYDCTIFDDNSEVCDSRALRDIKDRIRKLRGKGDA